MRVASLRDKLIKKNTQSHKLLKSFAYFMRHVYIAGGLYGMQCTSQDIGTHIGR